MVLIDSQPRFNRKDQSTRCLWFASAISVFMFLWICEFINSWYAILDYRDSLIDRIISLTYWEDELELLKKVRWYLQSAVSVSPVPLQIANDFQMTVVVMNWGYNFDYLMQTFIKLHDICCHDGNFVSYMSYVLTISTAKLVKWSHKHLTNWKLPLSSKWRVVLQPWLLQIFTEIIGNLLEIKLLFMIKEWIQLYIIRKALGLGEPNWTKNTYNF